MYRDASRVLSQVEIEQQQLSMSAFETGRSLTLPPRTTDIRRKSSNDRQAGQSGRCVKTSHLSPCNLDGFAADLKQAMQIWTQK